MCYNVYVKIKKVVKEMEKYTVRASFVVVKKFATFEEAVAYADKLGEVFGTWNVEMCKN